jgi:hypothetical protein
MPKILPATFAAATATLMALPALADNRSRVEAFTLPDGTFEVVAEFSEDALYWCGASEAAKSISAPGTQRIYVLQGPAPSRALPGQRAVRFSLTPPPGNPGGSSFTAATDIVGNSLTVAQAAQTCNERSASG